MPADNENQYDLKMLYNDFLYAKQILYNEIATLSAMTQTIQIICCF